MIIKLLPKQIQSYWEEIKFAAITADVVDEKNFNVYCIDLLLSLLNETTVCLMSVGSERQLQRVYLLSFIQNEIQDKKIMWVKLLYSFISSNAREWGDESQQLYSFAKSEGCSEISIQTANEAIIDLAQKYGFKEESRNYKISL